MNKPVKPGETIITPGGQNLVDDITAPAPEHFGRYWKPGETNPTWSPVCEEVPPTGLTYVRTQGVWVETSATPTDLLVVTEVIPALATVGAAAFTAHVYGAGFDATTTVAITGTAVLGAPTVVSPNEITLSITPPLTLAEVGTLTVAEPAGPGKGAAGVHFELASTTTPHVTEVIPALATVGFSAALQANVYGTGFAAGTQVLWDGTALATTVVSANQLSFTIDTTMGVAPSSVTVTASGATGAAGFVFIPSAGQYHFDTGLSFDDTTREVDLTPAGTTAALLGGVYVPTRDATQAADVDTSGGDGKLVVLTATDTLLGGMLEPVKDGTPYERQWNETAQKWEWVKPTATATDYGLGLTYDETATPPLVNLNPAGPTQQHTGGVWVEPRTATQGLSLYPGADPLLAGQLSLPPADDLLLGGLTEPPQDGLPYARKFDTTTTPNKWIWEPTVAAGLQITGLIPDNVMIPSTTPVPVTAYGAEFTPTCVFRIDGVDVVPPATIVSTTKATFTIDPTPETVGRTVTVTVHDPVAVPPALVDGMGAEAFEFQELVEALYRGRWQPATNVPDIVTLTKEDQWMWVADIVDPAVPEAPLVALPGYTGTIKEGDHVVWDLTTASFLVISSGSLPYHFDTGLSFDDVTREVDLQPAGDSPATLGGVYVIDRVRNNTEGLELGLDGRLRVPPATDALLGGILEPPPDDKGYVRRRTVAGVSAWVPPSDTPLLYQGLWQPAANSPDLAAIPNKLPGWMWIADTVDPNVPENAPATLPAIGGLSIDEGDHIVWDGTMFQLVQGNSQGLYRGRWRPAANVPDIGALTKQAEWTWLADIATPGIPELAPAGLPGIGGVPINEGDHVVWDGTTFILIAAAPDLTVTEVIPSFAVVGSPVLQARVYGSGFSATSRVLWDGAVILSTFIDSTKLRIDIDPTGETVPRFVTVTVEDGPAYGISADGSAGFYFTLPGVEYGIGLAVSPGAPGVPPAPDDPPIVNLTPAGLAPQFLGGVWVPPRGELNGLEINISSQPGMLVAPPATDKLAGVIVEPPVGPGQLWARTTSAPGTGKWEPVSNIGTLTYKGAWKPATNDPNIHAMPNKLNGDFWIVDCVDPLVAETPPLGSTPGLDNVMVEEGDFVIWNEAAQLWNHIVRTETVLQFRYGLIESGGIVDVTPATGGNQAGPPELGGVYGTLRSDRNAVVIDSNGHINVPTATDTLLGGMLEPPPDQKGYVRASQADGTWQWVPPADTTVRIATVSELGVVKVPARGLMTGLDIDTQGNLTAPKATHQHLGTILEPPEADKQYARFRDPVTGINAWQEVTASGVTISDTPPPNPKHEDLWWEWDSGDLFIFYVDPSGPPGQWVEAVAGAEPGVTMHVSDAPPDPMIAKAKDLWFDSDSGALAINYQDVDSTQWVQIGGSSGAAGGITEAPIDGTPYSRQDATWVATTALSATAGDLKHGFQTNDHAGWVKLDGRAVSTLTASQQAAAALLGFTANLPLGDGAVFMQSAAALGTVGGGVLTQAMLPAVTLNTSGHDPAAVTTSTAGAHDHFDPLNGWVDVDAIPTGVPVHVSDEGNRISLGGHSHTVDLPSHTHTVPLGGTGATIVPKNVSANAFLYLGA